MADLPEQTKLSRLVTHATRGRRAAVDELVPLIYDELRRIAHRRLRAEQTGHTLDTTGLVHEAYLRLVGSEHLECESRAHVPRRRRPCNATGRWPAPGSLASGTRDVRAQAQRLRSAPAVRRTAARGRGARHRTRLARGGGCARVAARASRRRTRGLAQAHERGIVHRDIMPANLIVTADGVLKILDFSIAMLGRVARTGPGATPGTAAYMSPGQTRPDAVDARTDLRSLGVVMCVMLAGRRPFHRGDSRAIGAAVCTAAPDPIPAWRDDVPPRLDQLVRATLAKDPAGRPGSAARVAAELDAIQAALGAHLAARP